MLQLCGEQAVYNLMKLCGVRSRTRKIVPVLVSGSPYGASVLPFRRRLR